MCRQRRNGGRPAKGVDNCISPIIAELQSNKYFNIIASCCGHSKYNITIIVKVKVNGNAFYSISIGDSTMYGGKIYDLISGVEIPRKVKFYKRNKQGVYFIPEAVAKWKKNKPRGLI